MITKSGAEEGASKICDARKAPMEYAKIGIGAELELYASELLI
jgi:hypothetical protein